jgi:hypothetical protein
MSKSPARVLLVGHSASRNGATVLLLEELNWLKRHTDLDIEVLMCGAGPLLEDFGALAPTKVWRDPRHSLGVLLKGRSRRLLPFLERRYAHWTLPRAAYDLVYCNTSAMARHIPHLARLGSPILWHIHELPFAMEVSVEPEEEQPAVLATTRFVAVSSVRDAITARWGAPALEVDAFADLCDDVASRRRLGATAFEKVRRHQTVGVQCGRLLTSMLACMTLGPAAAHPVEKRPASHPRFL